MNLYRIVNGIGTYWVIAEHPTEAEQKLIDTLNKNDYGFTDDRKAKEITVIAESVEDKYLTKKFLIL